MALKLPPYTVKNGDIILTDFASQLSLRDTLDCGQAFRWKETETGYRGVAYGKILSIDENSGDIILRNTTEDDFLNIWADYFDLYTDYNALRESFSFDSVMKDAMEFAPAIRVLHQSHWETTCSFIISANNNIKRIKGIVEGLCELFGDRLEDGFYSFPSPERIAALTPEDLAPIRSGYRAPYIISAAKTFAENPSMLTDIESLPTPEAKKALLKVMGVGPKVADCILLFSYRRHESFPMDTWMKKVMAVLYPNGLPEGLVKDAGIAQQYLFHYARNNAELFNGEK